jgi:hypothetical protein
VRSAAVCRFAASVGAGGKFRGIGEQPRHARVTAGWERRGRRFPSLTGGPHDEDY